MIFWLLTSEFPPVSGGGISTYCFETVNMLAAKGHHVTVFTQDFSISEIKEERKETYKIIRFNSEKYYTNSFLGYEANLSYAFAEVVKVYLEKEGVPDVLEAQEYMGIAYYLLQFKHLQYPLFKNLKVLVTLHSPSFLYLEYNQVNYHRLPYYWVGEMEKSCIAGADMLISPSKYLVEEIQKRMDICGRKVYIVKNPYQISNQETCIGKNEGKIVFFGKLTPQKGCLKLIDYFKHLWKEGFRIPLVMIGGGDHLYHPEGIDMVDFIKQKYKKEMQAGLLQLTGAILPDELDHKLSEADVILVPSIVDNLPYVVLEAMGRGKIVLASVQGGQQEFIKDGINGFLFDHQEEYSFIKKLQFILKLNDEEKIQITENAIQTIQHEFSYELINQEKIVLLQELIKQKGTDVFPFIRPIKTQLPLSCVNVNVDPLLSVVIPYYNMGAFVEATIISLKNADYKNIEILIVNDGSDDPKSIEILETIQVKYDVKILHQVNKGLSCARNAGARMATGQYLAFLDPDDTIEPSYYSKALQVLNTYKNVFFVGCWAKYFGTASGYWPSFNPEPPYLLFHNMVNSSALIYKKEAFLKVGLNDKEMIFGMEDYESVISLVKYGCQGVILPEPLWNYRIRNNSMARAFTTDKKLYLYRKIANKHADFYALHASEVINLLNANGPGIGPDNPTLIYDLFGTRIFSARIRQKLVAAIKSKPKLRKAALMIKKRLKN